MLLKHSFKAMLMLSLVIIVSCKKSDQNTMSFHDVEAVYYNNSNVMVLFRVGDAFTGLPPKDIKAGSENLIEVYEDGEKLSSSEGGNSSVSTPTTFIVDLLVLVDVSGSVESKIATVKSSLKNFITTLKTKTAGKTVRLSIRTFDGSEETKLITDFTSLDDANSKVNLIQPGEDKSTNLHGAIVESADILAAHEVSGEAHASLKKKGFIIFTDGKDQAARATLAEANSALVEIKKEAEFVYGVAVQGESYGQNFLSNFGSQGVNYFLVDKNFTDLNSKFNSIVDNLDALAKSYRVAKICSPKRNGVHYISLKVTGSPYASKYIEFNANGFSGGCNVDKSVQWVNPTTNKYLSTSALLTSSEMTTAKDLYSKVKIGSSSIYFRKDARSPSARGGWVSNYSSFNGSSVACHLYFPEGASPVAAGTDMTIADFASYNGIYNEGGQFIGANFVARKSNGEVYLLQCREVGPLNTSSSLESVDFNF